MGEGRRWPKGDVPPMVIAGPGDNEEDADATAVASLDAGCSPDVRHVLGFPSSAG